MWEFFAGLVLLIAGSEALLRGATSIKRRLKVPGFVIGLVIVGFGTSLPELVIGLGAASVGAQELAIAMVMGSNTFNLLGVLGIAALVAPLATDERALKRDGSFMALAAIALAAVAVDGRLGLIDGIALVAALALYCAIVAISERWLPAERISLHSAKAAFAGRAPESPWFAGALIIAGIILVIWGSGWVIEATIGLAIDLGVGEATLGLSLVAIATSMPELMVSVIAARRGEHGVAVGNVLGSNIFNIFGVGGLIGIGYGTAFPKVLAGADMAVLLVSSAAILVALATDRRLSRVEGVVALAAYAAYIVWRTGVLA